MDGHVASDVVLVDDDPQIVERALNCLTLEISRYDLCSMPSWSRLLLLVLM